MDIWHTFNSAIANAREELRDSPVVHTKHWQGVDVSRAPEMATHELLNHSFTVRDTDKNLETLATQIGPNLPWADRHFEERVCGVPINPGVEWANWPWGNSASKFRDECLGPTIPAHEWAYLAGMLDGDGTIYFREKERWQGVIRVYQKDPMVCHHLFEVFKVGKVTDNNVETKTNIHGKEVDNHCWYWQINAQAEARWVLTELLPYLVVKKEQAIKALSIIQHSINNPSAKGSPPKKVWDRDWPARFNHNYMSRYWPHGENGSDFRGMKYKYGDLNDVVKLLARDPLTRQAFLPVWFPEDTGGNNGRAPCTLGYHFIMRNCQLHVVYYIRSCDFLRHFRDDIYLTVRLQQWMRDEVTKLNEEWRFVSTGSFTMHITSLHLFVNDYRQVFG